MTDQEQVLNDNSLNADRLTVPHRRSNDRDFVAILADNLKTGSRGRGQTRTHLMNKANMSHRKMDEYVSYPLGNGLLQIDDIEKEDQRLGTKQFFRATNEGIKLLDVYSSPKDLRCGLEKFTVLSGDGFREQLALL